MSKEYVRLCALAEMPKRFGKRVELEDGIEIALFEVDGILYAVDNICPHQKFPLLYEGDLQDCVLTCPMHSWQFDIRTGECLAGGSAHLATYKVVVENGDILMERPEAATPKWME